MAEYDSARALALRLIKKKGRSGVNLVKVGSGSPSDSAKPWKADGESPHSSADVPLASGLHAVFLSPIEARSFEGQFAFPVFSRSRSDLQESVLAETTYMVYIADSELPNGLELAEKAVGLLLESQGTRYVVLRCQTFRPGEQAILHIFSVKG